jgi:propionyl-CoA synthetase
LIHKGDVPFAFVCLKKDSQKTQEQLTLQLIKKVRDSIGPVASFKRLVVVKRLPKTRSGKITRNCLKAMLNNEPYSVPQTIEDATVFAEIKQVLQVNGFERATEPTSS